MSRNLLTRILVAAVAIPAILWISYLGGSWLFGMVLLLALVAISEFLANEGFKPKGPIYWVGVATIVLLMIAVGDLDVDNSSPFSKVIGQDSFPPVVVIITVFYLVTAILMAVRKRPPTELFKSHSRLVWGVLYVGLLYPIVFKLGNGFENINGGDCLLFLFALLWIGDTAAMGVGKWLGKHQLAPTISPNKTVEGFIAAIIAAAIVGVVMFYWKFQNLQLIQILIIAVGCSIFGQSGDLFESMWKRSLGIKDASGIIPGHGGVLDRFDSLLFAAPFMYGFFYLFKP
ncbi:MAG: phosphatidate cytidylyltransferase [Candidatus Zixiibacteriota bacterium]